MTFNLGMNFEFCSEGSLKLGASFQNNAIKLLDY